MFLQFPYIRDTDKKRVRKRSEWRAAKASCWNPSCICIWPPWRPEERRFCKNNSCRVRSPRANALWVWSLQPEVWQNTVCVLSAVFLSLRVRAAVKTIKLAVKHIERGVGQRGGCRGWVVITGPEPEELEPEGKIVGVSSCFIWFFRLFYFIFK